MPRLCRLLVAGLCAGAVLPACRVAEERPAPPTPTAAAASRPTPSPAAAVADAEVERLRALGYLDSSDEPAQAPGSGTLLLDRRRAAPGATLVIYDSACAADLITLEGKVINSWAARPGRRWEQARLGRDGTLLVVGSESDTNRPAREQMEAAFLLKLSWSNELLWRRRLSLHHDLAVLPDGSLLTLLLERRPGGSLDPTAELWDNPIARLDGTGQMVETISLLDILAAPGSRFPLRLVGRGEAAGERWVDLLHCNAIEVIDRPDLADRHPLYGAGNVLVTSRSQDAVLVVNLARRKVVWWWGQGQLSGPHGGTLLANGNLLIFDNGLDRRWSRVIELDPVTERIVHQYATPRREDFFSRVMGAAQGLPNGNVLITNSGGGQGLELTTAGELVWEFVGSRKAADGDRVKIPRMTRISPVELDAILAAVGAR